MGIKQTIFQINEIRLFYSYAHLCTCIRLGLLCTIILSLRNVIVLFICSLLYFFATVVVAAVAAVAVIAIDVFVTAYSIMYWTTERAECGSMQ